MATPSNGFQTSSYHGAATPSTATLGNSEIEIASDPASSGFFASDMKKLEDLKTMLDSNKDQQKLDALKQIIGMVARGRNCSELFPAIVKNVVSKNVEVKKLVYVYLTRYAEEQQDLALLSISTFQRALKDPNQLIRGSALRVLSSIRVPMIVPIMMLAIREAANDMSPYVRKTAAHAIPKLYSLDPEQKDYLIEVIEKLLNDSTTLVAGSVIQAFEEVCPERLDLIHKHYRRLCALLVDVEEWGQVVIINMLTRYVRCEFESVSQQKPSATGDKFLSSDDDSAEDGEKNENGGSREMDPDHRLLLKNCKPLLNSRNSAVVVAVAQLYYHCAPASETALVSKSLVRLLRSHSEVQFVVLNNIASMTIHHRGLFEPYIKSFFVHSSDPSQVKLLKLEILTNMASETSINVVLKEFQSYVTSSDKEFAAATIQAIGRCASQLPEIMDTCMSGLIHLLSKKDETVVAESVVVIRKLLQMQITLKVGSCHKDIIVNMARLVDSITVPMARASILWLIGEYTDRVPKIAPDVLRKCAKTFCDEEDIVKLQILNLAAKLCIVNSRQTRLLVQYVLNMAKYDQNYDIRDRSRFLRAFLFPTPTAGGATTANGENPQTGNNLPASAEYFSKHAKKILLTTKPAPVLHSKFQDRPPYQLSTLSHLLNHPIHGYSPLPEWPEKAPDHAALRDVPVVTPSYMSSMTSGGSNMQGGGPETFGRGGSFSGTQNLFTSSTTGQKGQSGRLEDFYSDLEGEEVEDEDEDESEEDDEEEDSDEKEKSSEESEDDEDNDADDDEEDESSDDSSASSEEAAPVAKSKTTPVAKPSLPKAPAKAKAPSTSESEEEDEDSDDDDEDDDDDDEVDAKISKSKPAPQSSKSKPTPPQQDKKSSTVKTKPAAAEMPLLLDLDDYVPAASTTLLQPQTSTATVASPAKPSSTSATGDSSTTNNLYIPTNVSTKTLEAISRSTAALSHGVWARYRFSRSVSVFQPQMVSLELQLTNAFSPESGVNIRDVSVNSERLQGALAGVVDPFSPVDMLSPGGTTSVVLAVNFKDSTQAVKIPLMAFKEKPQDVHTHSTETGEEAPATVRRDKQMFDLTIQPPVGELLQPVNMTDVEFIKIQSALKGMTEFSNTVRLSRDVLTQPPRGQYRNIVNAVYNSANITSVSLHNNESVSVLLRFAGRTVCDQVHCLIELALDMSHFEESELCSCKVRINCEKITIGSQLEKELSTALAGLNVSNKVV